MITAENLLAGILLLFSFLIICAEMIDEKKALDRDKRDKASMDSYEKYLKEFEKRVRRESKMNDDQSDEE